MRRRCLLIAALLTALLGVPGVVGADEPATWPYYPIDDHFRGAGHYFSWLKLAVIWLVFLGWMKTTGWLYQDSQKFRARLRMWTPIVVGVFAGTLGLFWFLSSFSLGFSLLLLAYILPTGSYVFLRNRGVEPDQRVLTPSHLQDCFSDLLSRIGIGSRVDDEDEEPTHAVQLLARCGETNAANNAISKGVVMLPGYDSVGALLGEMLSHRAAAVMMEVQGDQVAMRYLIDGVWHRITSQAREMVEPVLVVVRSICTGDPTGQRATTQGDFEFVIREREYVCQVTQQKKQGVYRIVLKLDEPICPFDDLESLGMHPKMADQLRERLDSKSQMVLFSSLPGGGLSTTLDTVLGGVDRIRRDCAVVESDAKYERDVDATDVRRYEVGDSPASVLEELFRSWPDLLLVREMADAQTARMLCEQAKEDCLVVSTIAAKNGLEILLRVLMLKLPASEFANVVSCVVYQRLIRKLCEHCKEAYEPPSQLLKQLGLPADRVKALYRPPTSPEDVCPHCRGIGYRGRTGLFEMLVVDDAIRELLTTKPSLDGLKALTQQKGMRTIRDFGIVLAARGETSIEELSRVLSQ